MKKEKLLMVTSGVSDCTFLVYGFAKDLQIRFFCLSHSFCPTGYHKILIKYALDVQKPAKT